MKSKSILLRQGGAFLMLAVVAACDSKTGGSGAGAGSAGAPTVLSNGPLDDASGVPVNASLNAVFSEKMDSATLTVLTFTLTFGVTAIPVDGTVIYANSRAAFWPAAHLEDNGVYTATITTGAEDVSGVGLKKKHVWSFTTGDTMGPGDSVDLGTAGNFAILAKSGVSTVPASAITGNLGISPAAATSITGFDLILDASNVFSTSSQVIGKVYAADYAPPTPTDMTNSVHDMEIAFTDAAGRAPDFTELGAGDIGGMTLVSGVYKWGTGLLIPTDVTLNGSATDVWVFQIAADLIMSSAAKVVLTGGALPENVFWQVTGLVDLDTTAHLNGIILTATAITLRTGASVNGRLLAQTAVSIDGSTVVEPIQ